MELEATLGEVTELDASMVAVTDPAGRLRVVVTLRAAAVRVLEKFPRTP
jgi:hypothetical protein